MIVYAFIRNWCTFESADEVVSLHFKKADAYRAMRRHVWDVCVTERNSHLQFGHGADFYRVPDWTKRFIKQMEIQ